MSDIAPANTLSKVVEISEALSTHTTSSLPNIIGHGLYDTTIKVAYVASRVCIQAASKGETVYTFLKCAVDDEDVLMPLTVHRTWQALSLQWGLKNKFVPKEYSAAKISMYELPLCTVLATSSDVITHTCPKCQRSYFSQVNQVWCLHAHGDQMLLHDQEALARHWDNMSLPARLAFVRPFRPSPDDTYEPAHPSTKKLWNVTKGQVAVSGSTLMEGLNQATEGTYLARVSLASMKQTMPELVVHESTWELLSLLAHQLTIRLAQSLASSTEEDLLDQLHAEERHKQAQLTRRKAKKHMKWLEKEIFSPNFEKIQWDVLE